MATKYWFGGAGTWDSVTSTNWSLTSGGTTTTTPPTSSDDAVFDANSGTGAIAIANTAVAASVNCTGILSTLQFSGASANTLTISGNITFGTGQTFVTASAPQITLNGTSTGHITKFNGVTYPNNMTFSGTGTYTMQDAFTCSNPVTITAGTFDANTFNFTASRLAFTGGNTRTLKMGGGTWTLSGTGTVWSITGSGYTIDKSTSNISLTATNTTTRTFAGAGLIYNKLTVGGSTGTSTLVFTGSNRFSEIASSKTVASAMQFTSGTLTIVDKFTANGAAGALLTLNTSTTATATLQRGSPWNIGTNSTATNCVGVNTVAGDNDYITASYIRGEYVGGSMIEFFS